MNTEDQLRLRCRACGRAELRQQEETQTFAPPTGPVHVVLLRSQCGACNVSTTLASQHDENLVRLRARRVSYGPYLLGEDIIALRHRYGLTQRDASRVFGKGKIAFSRYENEKSYPDLATTRLLRLAIRHPLVLKELADESGVALPLWEDRLSDSATAYL